MRVLVLFIFLVMLALGAFIGLGLSKPVEEIPVPSESWNSCTAAYCKV